LKHSMNIRVLAILLFLVVHISADEGEPIYNKQIGVEILYPGVTARYVGQRFGVVLNAGLNSPGYVNLSDESSYAHQTNIFQLFGRLNIFRFGKSLNLHLTAGSERQFPFFLGAGLSLYKEIDSGYFFFLDTDLCYIRSRLDFSYYEYGYPNGDRLQIGFLKGF
jgi:hypothetical protein